MSRVTLSQLERLLLDAAGRFGKLDVSAKRNYVFALLLLKRCSDVFERAWQREYDAELARTGDPEEAREAADDPDSYTTEVFVPRESRWSHFAGRSTEMGKYLNAALTGLEAGNEDLGGVLRHVDFNGAPDGTRLGDATLVELVRMFSGVRLGDDDLEFPGLLGTAYERVLRTFAELGDAKGGDFYTPRPMVRMMVRIADPRPGGSVYDPCAGSAGMLVYAREHVADHHPGQEHTLALAGQELSAAHWTAGRINLLLHGIRDADVRLGDTLTEPRHLDGGLPRRFTRILSNPEFSWKDYDPAATAAHHYRRFEYGKAPSADLMFVQHMVASLTDDGVAVTLMPHGVLFRDRAEREIREKLLHADVVEAVIGLGPNIQGGTGIPACLLVLRAPGGKPSRSRGKVLFVNADREYRRLRKQNQLGEEHIEKIVRTYAEWREIEGFSRAVPVADLLADGANLNIRRWVDNTPAPEPQDVSAHLYGGIPRAEVEALTPAFAAYGLAPAAFFTADPGDGYLDFPPEGHEVTAARVDGLAAVREAAFREAVGDWWRERAVSLRTLPEGGTPMAVRAALITSFRDLVKAEPLLDEFTAAGVVAEWWADNLVDIKTLAARGAKHLVELWAADAVAALPVRRMRGKPRPTTGDEWRAVRERPFVARLLPRYGGQAAGAEAAHAELDARVKALEEEGSADGLKKLKADRDGAAKAVDAIAGALPDAIERETARLTPDEAGQVVVDVLGRDVLSRVEARLEAARRDLTAGFRRLADKYEVSLEDLEREREASASRLAGHLRDLGYQPRRRHQMS